MRDPKGHAHRCQVKPRNRWAPGSQGRGAGHRRAGQEPSKEVEKLGIQSRQSSQGGDRPRHSRGLLQESAATRKGLFQEGESTTKAGWGPK